ncbi:MAG: peptidoglycan editing factor PgeF [Pseudanabaenaceae cyanobacterium bins.39]|nr:peptidoglycan editing factor PgeF [Pseudanabaenaceae cyanobacterium bins.39]
MHTQRWAEPVTDQWQWQNGVLTCKLLANWKHGFFTKAHAPQLPDQLHQSFGGAGVAYRAKQVHSDRLVHVQEIRKSQGTLPEADGVWLSHDAIKEQDCHSVWVCTADCVPVLIGDRHSGAVAAVHAGWRGTAAGIVIKAIATLCDQGSNLADLRIALGPAISGAVYQVSQEVADRVTATVSIPVGIMPDEHPERVKLDLRQVQLQQLQELGIPSQNVAIAPYCTLQDEEIFFSYRRYTLSNPNPLPRAPQVQWSGIAIN